MTTTTIVGGSCTALSIWTRSNLWSRAASTAVIYMKTPKRIFPSHSPDFCVESLVRSLARARERSILLRRGSLVALASSPHLATPNVHARRRLHVGRPSSRRLLLTWSNGLPTCRRRSFARIQFTGEPINCWHTYVFANAHASYCFSLIESFVNVSLALRETTMWVSLYVTWWYWVINM